MFHEYIVRRKLINKFKISIKSVLSERKYRIFLEILNAKIQFLILKLVTEVKSKSLTKLLIKNILKFD